MITTHGFALNVKPDLKKFNAIVPCGIKEHGICSMQSLGIDVDDEILNQKLSFQFCELFFNI